MNLPSSITYNDLRVRLQNINCCLAKKADKLNTLLTLGKSCTDDVIKLEFAYKLLDILKTYNTNLVLIPEIQDIQTEVSYESQAEANCITMTQLDNMLQYLQDYCSICFKEYGTYDSGYIVSNDLGGWVGSNPSLIISTQVQADWDQMDNLQPDFIKNKPEIPELLNLIAGDNITITGTYPNLTITAANGDQDTIYPNGKIPFGDGTTPGGITDNNFNFIPGSNFNAQITDGTTNDSGFWANVNSSGLYSESATDYSFLNLSPTGLQLKLIGSTNKNAGFDINNEGFNIYNFDHSWLWPIADGTSGQTLVTDGAGNLSFQTISSMVYPGVGIPLSTGTGWDTSITNNSDNWNTAYSWGNHADAGYMLKSTYDTDNDGVVDSAQSMMTIGRNSTGSTLYKGTIVYILGSTGNRPNFVKAQANEESTSAGTFGVVYADIANNSDGYVVTIGTINTLDTRTTATNPFTSNTLADGDTIYLSPDIAGYITNVKPYAPNHIVYLGKVVKTHPTQGTIVYRIQNGYELDELHNVQATSPNSNDTLYYDNSVRLWKTASLTSILGYTPYNSTNPSGYITSSALSPYLTSSTAASTYVSLTGSYSNPSWITGLAWSKISSTPTTLAGYGITDAVPSARTLTINGTTYDLSVNRSWTINSLPSGTQGDILYYNGSAWVVLNAGTSGYVLQTNGVGANPSWAVQSGGFSNPMTTVGDIIYGGSSGTATRLAGNTTSTKKFLRSTGTGIVAQNPDWDTISYSDVSGGSSRQVLTDINWSGVGATTQGISVGNYSDTLVTITNINTISGTATFSAISGSVDGQRLRIRFSSSGPSVAKPISFPSGNNFVSRGDTLPTAVVAGKWMVILLEYFAQDSKWGCLAVTIES